jgi:hypothetical protein
MFVPEMDYKSLIIKHLLSKNYYLAKTLYLLRFSLLTMGKQPLIIFQMGKVGSTTILHSLKTSLIENPLFQVHVLSSNGIEKMEENYYGNSNKFFSKSLLPQTKHLFASHFLRTKIQNGNRNNKWQIITLVRDPIARNLSEFFYSIADPKDDPHIPKSIDLNSSINIKDLKDRFLKRFHEQSDDYKFPLKWFDEEMKVVFGVDVYLSSFPKDVGYKVYRGERADILLLKLEYLNYIYNDALQDFIGPVDFSLVSVNTTRTKGYYPIYKKFLEDVQLPESYIEKIYTTKYVQHFYSQEEIRRFRQKWYHQPHV